MASTGCTSGVDVIDCVPGTPTNIPLPCADTGGELSYVVAKMIYVCSIMPSCYEYVLSVSV